MTVQAADGGPSLQDLEDALRARLPSLLSEVGDMLRGDWPDYARFLDDSDSEVADAGALFIRRLLDMARQGLSKLDLETLKPDPAAEVVFEQIGRKQWAGGHELTELMSAYQVGARVAWRHVSDTALTLALPPEVLSALAEAVFVFVNQLTASSAHGFVVEQSESSAAREALRRELSELLLSDRSDSAAIGHAADCAGWRLPALASVILVDPTDEGARAIVDRLGSETLPIRTATLYGAIAPNGNVRGGKAHAAKVLHGAHAIIGHGVPLTTLPASIRIVQAAMDLQHRGLLSGDPIIVDEHLDTIIVHRDERIMAALRAEVLEPLSGVPVATRDRMIETLTSWLRHMGDRQRVAEELRIHPQTVRYRVAQLREHFGVDLDSPQARSRMYLALMWGAPSSGPD